MGRQHDKKDMDEETVQRDELSHVAIYDGSWLLSGLPQQVCSCRKSRMRVMWLRDNLRNDVEHTFFSCGRWARKLAELKAIVEQNVTSETVMTLMLRNTTNWKAVERYVVHILRTKEKEERQRR